jgi:CMP-N,N'-diacetyllegionaminic acid synthase
VIIGLIPARGGSKGLPRKNILEIAGKPLIAWTIEAAQAATSLDRFSVSTEDEEIADVARAWGAEVLERPLELATDIATSLSVWQHALEAHPADVLVNLYPTSPVRDHGLIDATILQFTEQEPSCLATGYTCHFMPFGTTDDGLNERMRRQDVDGFFHDDGNVYVADAAMVRGGLQYGDRLAHFPTSRECNIEIDDEFDFWMAERILERRLTEDRQ